MNFFLHWPFSNLTLKDLLPCIDVVLRVALNRLHLDASCLGKLISVTTPRHPKAQDSIQGGVDVINVLFDILGDGFRMKTKIAPSTIKVLIEVCLNWCASDRISTLWRYWYRPKMPRRLCHLPWRREIFCQIWQMTHAAFCTTIPGMMILSTTILERLLQLENCCCKPHEITPLFFRNLPNSLQMYTFTIPRNQG